MSVRSVATAAGTYTERRHGAVKGGEIRALVDLLPDVRKKVDKPDSDRLITRLAEKQHGVVSLPQLRSAGLSSTGINRRVTAARLHRIHRGVYAVGHRGLGQKGEWMAAVLACGEGAVLSHRSAAELWGIRRRDRRPMEAGGRGELSPIDVTVSGTSGKRRRQGIALHRSSTLSARDCTRRDEIPVTKPARTLSDLRSVLSKGQFAAALREAEFLRLPIGEWNATDRARTDLEQNFLALCRRHRLPKPSVNVKVDRFEVDFLWPKERLIVEVDGWDSHRSRSAFEENRARDARLAVLGYEVVRFTWRQIESDPRGVAKTIRSLWRERVA
jgi:very-short-patch-repair endonuclease